MKVITNNNKARHEYKFFDTFEAGLELKGSEVKSLRNGTCSIAESYVGIEGMQAFVYSMHIPEFDKASFFKPDPNRKRKLLLHKQEINKLMGLTAQKGYTIVPLKIYFNDKGLVKIQIALAKGMLHQDKRRKIKDAIVERETARELKNWRVKG